MSSCQLLLRREDRYCVDAPGGDQCIGGDWKDRGREESAGTSETEVGPMCIFLEQLARIT